MAITNFIPEVWSARLTHNLEEWSVFYNNANRNYEGDANMGDTVRIFTLADNVTVRDYSRDTDIAAPEDLDTTEQSLLIDQEKYFHFAVDDLDAVQARSSLLDQATSNAAREVAQDIDGYVASLFAAIPNSGAGAWGHRVDGTTFNLNFTSTVKLQAAKMGLPLSGLVAVTTPEIIEKIDNGRVSGTYGETGREGTFTGRREDVTVNSGFYDTVNGLRFFASNDSNLAGSSKDSVWVFDPRDLSLVVQVNRVEGYRPERRFADAVKGLWNYGSRITNAGRMMEFTFNRA